MNKEIERKFLVEGDFKQAATTRTHIKQGYLSAVPERTVRIRIAEPKAYITIKGKSDESGMGRLEWEKEIPLHEAEALFELCEPNRIEKVRYIVPYNGQQFEVDEFMGQNKGLIMAELELNSHKQEIEQPHWLSKEVTGDKKYYNSYLSKYPYTKW